jgi:hypothetical protein
MENVKHIARSISYPSHKSISTRATQHLIDADDVKWVDSGTHMERILARRLGDIFVGADASCSYSSETRW